MKEGRRAATKGLTVFARLREPEGEVRLGCIVRSRGAVARNRARRRARAALDAAHPGRGVDVVVRVEEEGVRVPFQEMVEVVKKALDKVDQDDR